MNTESPASHRIYNTFRIIADHVIICKEFNLDVERLNHHTDVSPQGAILIRNAEDFRSAKSTLENRALCLPIHILVALLYTVYSIILYIIFAINISLS